MSQDTKTNPAALYDRLRLQASDAEYMAHATEDRGGDPGHAQAIAQIVIARALIDIAESLQKISNRMLII